MLRGYSLPVRFAAALAEPQLLGQRHARQAEAKNQVIDEAVAVDMVSRAAKHAVRHLLTQKQRQSERKEPQTRLWAVDLSAKIAQEAWPLSRRSLSISVYKLYIHKLFLLIHDM